MTDMRQQFKEYLKERDEILQSGDFKRFKAFMRNNLGRSAVTTDEVMEIAFHKVRTIAPGLKEEMRKESEEWLRERNMRSMRENKL